MCDLKKNHIFEKKTMSLPIEILRLIYDSLDTNKEFISFLSVSRDYHELKSKFCYNKGFFEYNTIYRESVPYFDNIICKTTFYDFTIKKTLPKNIQHLSLKFCYDEVQDIVLPSTILYLRVENMYAGQVITKEFLPRNLKEIVLNYNNELLPGVLPDTLEKIVLGDIFNKPIQHGVIPKNVKEFTFGRGYSWGIEPGILPSSLRKLTFRNRIKNPLLLGVIPENVKELNMSCAKGRVDILSKGIIIPPSVRILHLTTSIYFMHKEHSIPNTVKELYLCGIWNSIPLGLVPDSVRVLSFGNMYNTKIKKGSIPFGVETLIFGERFDQILKPGIIPSSVKKIVFGILYQREFKKGYIPEGVEEIYFNGKYISRLSRSNLPSTLKNVPPHIH